MNAVRTFRISVSHRNLVPDSKAVEQPGHNTVMMPGNHMHACLKSRSRAGEHLQPASAREILLKHSDSIALLCQKSPCNETACASSYHYACLCHIIPFYKTKSASPDSSSTK